MSYFYDAGAVVDMNNLVAGCLLPTPIQNCQPCSIPLEPAQVPVEPQGPCPSGRTEECPAVVRNADKNQR